MDDVEARARRLRAPFEQHRPRPTFGAEEEVMLLHPETLDLLPAAAELLDGMGSAAPAGVKLELPACQLELMAPVADGLDALCVRLEQARRRLATCLDAKARVAVAGAHPFAAVEGLLNGGGRYGELAREYGPVLGRQLICGLHVHVGLAGADRALAVYNALRGYLPEVAALAANAPIHGRRDSGMASVRPGIALALPRQGVPPAFGSWQQLAADMRWGEAAGRIDNGQGWWWEARLHPVYGTLEVRAPDGQSTPADAGAVIAVVAGLILWLAARHEAGETLPCAPSWRIAENRWSAARHGLHGEMIDLDSGARAPTRERLEQLFERLAPHVRGAGGSWQLDHARRMLSANGADQQRATFHERGAAEVAAELCGAFLEPLAGGC